MVADRRSTQLYLTEAAFAERLSVEGDGNVMGGLSVQRFYRVGGEFDGGAQTKLTMQH